MDQIQPEAAVTGPSAEIVIRFFIVFDPRKAPRQAFSQLYFSPGNLQLIILFFSQESHFCIIHICQTTFLSHDLSITFDSHCF